MNNIISSGLINIEKQRKYKIIAWSSSKTTLNDDKWQKLACSLAPACDDEIFSKVKNEFSGVDLYCVQSFRGCGTF